MIRVVIVDDQPVVRAGVARILGPGDGFEVVAECDDGDEVPAAVDQHQPDVVLMDIRMRRVDGVAAIRALSAAANPPPVLVLTTFDDDDVLWDSLDAGAAGFVLKDAVGGGHHRRGAGGGQRGRLARPEGRAAGAARLPIERTTPHRGGGTDRRPDRS